MTLMQRLWLYQGERFPLLSHGILVAALTVGVCGFASAGGNWPPLARMVGSFGVALGFFLLLRISDEFKDAADDATYRPYRPVPRGLVTLRELAGVGIAVVLLQLAITFLLGRYLLPYLVAAWLLLALMSQEFFVAAWLRARPLLYMLPHMLILPLIDLYLRRPPGKAKGRPLSPSAGFLSPPIPTELSLRSGAKYALARMRKWG
jgi:4-hydroxybenzoate polyprenyltransferase